MIRVFISILMYLIGWINEGHAQELRSQSAEVSIIVIHDEFLSKSEKAVFKTNFDSHIVCLSHDREIDLKNRTVMKKEEDDKKILIKN